MVVNIHERLAEYAPCQVHVYAKKGSRFITYYARRVGGATVCIVCKTGKPVMCPTCRQQVTCLQCPHNPKVCQIHLDAIRSVLPRLGFTNVHVRPTAVSSPKHMTSAHAAAETDTHQNTAIAPTHTTQSNKAVAQSIASTTADTKALDSNGDLEVRPSSSFELVLDHLMFFALGVG